MDLCRGRIPNHLLYAICAVAAPLSQNPLVRVAPVRLAGERFANAALTDLFNTEGRLMVSGLEAAQALALVQTYNVYKESNLQNDLRLYGESDNQKHRDPFLLMLRCVDIALRLLHSLHMEDADQSASDEPSATPDELYERGIQRESARRTFWLIHLVEVLGSVFTRRPTMYAKDDLAGVRLPSDEASFDLALQIPPGQIYYYITEKNLIIVQREQNISILLHLRHETPQNLDMSYV